MDHENYCPALDRFVDAQAEIYAIALAEIKRGQKESHWMWYIFPQIEGLGFSPTSQYYSIKGRTEATQYLNHPILGSRLIESMEAVLSVQGRSAVEIFGFTDAKKLRSCATLFAAISFPESVFDRVLEIYFNDIPDEKTLKILES